jgi:ABC-type sugar transport system substrate-binding protein
MKKGIRARIAIAALLALMLCSTAAWGQASKPAKNETYVMVGIHTGNPVFIPDQKYWHEQGKKLGVKTMVVGPADGNIPAMINAFEQTIAMKPAGIMVIGWDPSLVSLVNKAMDSGIPVITWDADLPTSKRIAHIGTNWTELGVKLAENLAKEVNYKGKVARVGVVGTPHIEAAFQSFADWMAKNAPNIEVLPVQDDKGAIDVGMKVTAALIAQYPDLAGIAGFDSNSGDGICPAVREAGKSGKIKVAINDILPAHMQFLKEGSAQYVLGQKRNIFGPLGLQMLYDINHTTANFTPRDKALHIYPVPEKVDTGFLIVTPSNVKDFEEGQRLLNAKK